MSGSCEITKCPECNGDMNPSPAYKPFNTVSGECLECGFYYCMATGQNTLEEVNNIRKDYGVAPLKELRPKVEDVG